MRSVGLFLLLVSRSRTEVLREPYELGDRIGARLIGGSQETAGASFWIATPVGEDAWTARESYSSKKFCTFAFGRRGPALPRAAGSGPG